MKVYFLPSYKPQAPSTRMRCYKVAEYLQKQGQTVEILPHNLSIAEKHQKLQNVQREDILYVQKWRTDFNAAEHLSQYKDKCKIVFDLDDLTGDEQALGVIRLCDALVVGNHHLLNYYASYEKPIYLVPTAVDLLEYPRFHKESNLSIGIAKCGISPILKPLFRLKDVLLQLHTKYNYTLFLAGFNNDNDKMVTQQMFPFAKCHELLSYDTYLKTTVPMLQRCTLGILPFASRDNGKSGHSTLANLAMGLPTCASPFAESEYIIEDGKNGFIAKTAQEWNEKIDRLFADSKLRQQIREEGWLTIANKYDVPVIGRQLMKYLKELQ